MREAESNGRKEQWLLASSVAITLAIGAVGILFGILSGSFSILFDGVYSLIDASISSLALMVARLILRDALRREQAAPGRVRYQFGFWHLEPMVLALNAALLVLAAAYGLASSVIVMFRGGTPLEFGPAILYAAVVAVTCFVMGWRQRRANRALGSGFVALDAKGWIMSGAITSALLVAFVLGAAVEGTALARWQPYVDPAVLALVCLILMPLPLSGLGVAVADIFLRAPDALDAHVTGVAQAAVTRHGFIDYYTYVARVGRSNLIEIHFILPPGWPVSSIGQMDAIRDSVGAAIGGEGPNRWLTICFTEDAEWAF